MIKAKCTDREKFVLVVSIDNLDRCPHRQIVKALEAAHLLLEQNEVRKCVCAGSFYETYDPEIVVGKFALCTISIAHYAGEFTASKCVVLGTLAQFRPNSVRTITKRDVSVLHRAILLEQIPDSRQPT